MVSLGQLAAMQAQWGARRVHTGQTLSAAQLRQQLQQQFTKVGNEYVLQAMPPPPSGTSQAQWLKILGDVENGDWAQAATDADMLLMTTMMAEGGPVGIALGVIMSGIMLIYGADHPSPCTIVGCGSTFNMPECDEFPDGRSPFTWASIMNLGPAAYAQQTGVLPGGWVKNWGDPVWACSSTQEPGMVPSHTLTSAEIAESNLSLQQLQQYAYCLPSTPDPTGAHGGGPDSFEDGLQKVLMSTWDMHATAPWLCKAMKDAGMDGSIFFGNRGNELAIWRMLFAYAGMLVQPFVSAWNATHTKGSAVVPCTSCPPGQTMSQSTVGLRQCYDPHTGYWSPCTATSPQRKITYGPFTTNGLTASGLAEGDPLRAAFYGLWVAAGLPDGTSISVMVNGGPKIHPAAPLKEVLLPIRMTALPLAPKPKPAPPKPKLVEAPAPRAVAPIVSRPRPSPIGMTSLMAMSAALAAGFPLVALGALGAGAIAGAYKAWK